jgi:hypothetical protein
MFAMIGNHPNMAFVVEVIAKFYAKPQNMCIAVLLEES